MHNWQFTLIMAGITMLFADNSKAQGRPMWAGAFVFLALLQTISGAVLFFVEGV